MKSKTFLLFIILISILMLSACGSNRSSSDAQDGELSSDTQTVLPNYLVKADSDVLLRRSGWKGFFPIKFGTALEPGDLLLVEEGGGAAIFCGDSSTWNEGSLDLVADGDQHGIPCQSGKPPRPWPDVAALRGEGDSNIPYAIYPRNSALLSNTPTLKWHVLEGVGEYTLSILSDDGLDREEIVVRGGNSSWPQDWPPLETNSTYVLMVEGGGKRSDEGNQTHSGVGFWLLDEDEFALVSFQVKELQEALITENAKNFLLAELYISHHLYAEAVQSLEGISTEGNGSSVYLMLGRVFLEIGSIEEAGSSFQLALETASGSGELEIQALAEYGLGLTLQFEEEEGMAKSHFEKAKEIFEKIGDQARLEEVEAILKK